MADYAAAKNPRSSDGNSDHTISLGPHQLEHGVNSEIDEMSEGRTYSFRVLESPKEVLTVLASGCREDEASMLLKWWERKTSMVM